MAVEDGMCHAQEGQGLTLQFDISTAATGREVVLKYLSVTFARHRHPRLRHAI